MNAIPDDLRRALDPVALAERIGMRPDDWQADVLRSDADRILLNCCRQSGKSTVSALLAVHVALYQPGALILLLSPSERQSKELFRKALTTYRTLGRPIAAEAENRLTLELETGSRIVCLPGQESTVRGYSNVSLLIVDEAARVEDDLYFSVRPMMAVSGGRLLALSTPYGTRGWWHDAWHSSDPWERYRVPATDCSRIPADFLMEERRNLGDWWYRQEYECVFLDAETQLFTRDEIDRLFDRGVQAWNL